MNCDLHTHSSASDGALAPLALLQRAVANGVDRLALTDHDTVAGVQRVAAQLCDVDWAGEWVAGVEISAHWQRLPVHIVGLWVDADAPRLAQFLAGQRQRRAGRAETIGVRLAAAGIEGALAGAQQQAGEAVLSRPHFARYLVEAGYCRDEQQAFKRWLGRGKAGDVRCDWPAMGEAIDEIHAVGGHAVLAHPEKYKLSRGKQRQLLGDFAADGGDAVEIISGPQDMAVTQRLLKTTLQFSLAGSIGSDFHSPAQHWCDVGSAGRLPDAIEPVWALSRRRLRD